MRWSPGARGCSTRATAARWNASIAKIFGSEAQKEAAIELFMKTHGGRSFLHGHLFGDNVHEYLAPCIYEGRRRDARHGVLQVAGQGARQDVLRADRQGAGQAAGIKKPNPLNPAHAWALREALVPYAKWRLAQMLTPHGQPELPGLPEPLADARRVRRRRAAAAAGWRSAA